MSWPIVQIGEVANVVGGATPRSNVKEFWEGSIYWITPKDLSKYDKKYISETPRKITKAGLRSCATQILPPNSVLFSSRAPIGHVAINTKPMATNQGFKSFVPGPKLDSSFLFWWLDANRKYLQNMGTGTTFKEVSKKTVQRIKIPLPPLHEQRRIAAILDQADELRRLRQSAITKLNDLGRSIFYEMFGDPAINPHQWPVGTIRDLVGEVRYGTSKKAHTEFIGIPILRMSNITYEGEIDLDDLKYLELTEKEIEKYTARKGDILFNRTNSRDLVGKTAVYESDKLMAIAGYLVRARVNDQADPYYIGAYMNSDHGKAKLRNMSKNIIGMANINAQEFQDISIAIPPIQLQIKFKNKIKQIKIFKNRLKKSQQLINYLFNSIQYFTLGKSYNHE